MHSTARTPRDPGRPGRSVIRRPTKHPFIFSGRGNECRARCPDGCVRSRRDGSTARNQHHGWDEQRHSAARTSTNRIGSFSSTVSSRQGLNDPRTAHEGDCGTPSSSSTRRRWLTAAATRPTRVDNAAMETFWGRSNVEIGEIRWSIWFETRAEAHAHCSSSPRCSTTDNGSTPSGATSPPATASLSSRSVLAATSRLGAPFP